MRIGKETFGTRVRDVLVRLATRAPRILAVSQEKEVSRANRTSSEDADTEPNGRTAFGMWKDRADPDEPSAYVRKLRRPRLRADRK